MVATVLCTITWGGGESPIELIEADFQVDVVQGQAARKILDLVSCCLVSSCLILWSQYSGWSDGFGHGRLFCLI